MAMAADLRTTALLSPSLAFLARLGLGDAIDAASAPLSTLRIVDEGSEGDNRRGQARDFSADQLEGGQFGRNIANSALRQALLHQLKATDRLDLIAPAEPIDVLRRDDAALLTLETPSGLRRLRAQLIVAADGKNSRLRASAGVAARRIDHGQRSTVCVFRHPEPHCGVSIEIYTTGGPCTLVPFLDDTDGTPRSSLVWMRRNADAAELEALDDPAFAAAATAQAQHAFGAFELASNRMSWPIQSLIAERFYAKRIALLGEAAHATPPIGAQGLNMSLTDAKALADLAADARDDIGSVALLKRYDTARRNDVAMRVGAVAALNLAADGVARPIRAARSLGLRAAHDVRPIRDLLVRRGLGGA